MASCDVPECREHHPVCGACRETMMAHRLADGGWKPVGGHFYEPHHCAALRVQVWVCPDCGDLLSNPFGDTPPEHDNCRFRSIDQSAPRPATVDEVAVKGARFLLHGPPEHYPESGEQRPADRIPDPDLEQEVRQKVKPLEKSSMFD